MNLILQQRALEICTAVMELVPIERERSIKTLADDDVELMQLVASLLDRINSVSELLPTGGAQISGVDQSGTHIDEYQLDRLLGSGGMGSVYLANRETNGVRQNVALKVMNLSAPGPAEIARFVGEQQVLAALHHPYIAALIDVGVTDRSTPYLVMEYVPGTPITTWCREQPSDIEERVRIWLRVCEAVQHAHQNLVVHRDIKPANVLVTADGLPKLLDFGIAKLLGTEAGGQTTRFARHLTLEYATPERILRNAVSTSEDIYALGVLLFELLCGARPFKRSDQTFEALVSNLDHQMPPALWAAFNTQPADRQAMVATERGLSLRALNSLLKGDLDAICTQALHPDRTRRFQSVDLFAEDVRAWLRGDPVKAKGDSNWYRLIRFSSRHRIGVLAALLSATALGGAMTVSVQQAMVVSQQAQRAIAVNEFLQEMLAAPNARWDTQWRGHADLRMSELLELASTHLDTRLQDQPEVRVQLYGSLARSFAALSMYERAVEEQRKALSLSISRMPADDPSQAAVATTMATMLDYTSTPQAIAEARQHIATALEWFDTYQPGPSHGRAATIGELGYSHHLAGEFTTAIEVYLEAMRMQLEVEEDPLDPLVALGYGLIGLAYFDNRQLVDATAYLDRSLSIYEHQANWNLVDATHVYAARALIFLAAGDSQGALDASRHALAISGQTQGRQSLDHFRILAGAAHIHCAAGAARECDRYLDEAEAILASGLAAEPIHLASIRLIRAERLLVQGNASAALTMLEPLTELAGISRVRSGAGFNAAGRWHLAMGQALRATGQPDAAKKHLDGAATRGKGLTALELPAQEVPALDLKVQPNIFFQNSDPIVSRITPWC